MRFEKTKKYEELKDKRDSREYEEWFLRYIPLENSKTKATGKKKKTQKVAVTKKRAKGTRQRDKKKDE
jgi:hypothetical protein